MKLENLSLSRLLILAILLRVLLMPFFYHPDIKTYDFQASFLSHGVVNIYSYLVNNKQSLPLKEDFVYFPLTYFTLGGYQIIISPFFGSDFQKFLFDASSQALVKADSFRYLFLM